MSRNSSSLTNGASKKGYSKKKASTGSQPQEAAVNQQPIVIASDNEAELDESTHQTTTTNAKAIAQPLQNPTAPSKHNSEKIEGGEQQITVS